MADVDVSVIIPTFHREAQLLEAIGSALAQDGVALEVIVVDDSAESSARAAVATVTDTRVQYRQHAPPSGGRPARVRNEGARGARGRFLYFLDDDDLLEAGTLAAMVAALDAAPAAGMAFGAIIPFGNDAARLREHQQYYEQARRIARRLRRGWQLAAWMVFRDAILVNSACMARRAAFSAGGGFDTDIPVCEDADLWARMALAGGFVYLDRPVVRYRTGAGSLMHNLAADDEKLHVSYRRIQDKFRRSQGALRAQAMKIWTRLARR